MAHLQIKNLFKTYGTVAVLRGLDFEIKSGELVSLLGPSGSGKTTALRCIAGLEKPDTRSGPILVDGLTFSDGSVFLAPENRGVGMVFQNYAVWPHLNVLENVAFPLKLQAKRGLIPSHEVHSRSLDALKLVKLDQYSARFASQLSGGQQQRVALARALAMAPKILFLDEPLSNLDAMLREELGAEIRRLQKKLGLTTVMVTHDQKEALSLSDRIYILKDGLVEASGTPEELYRLPSSPFVAEFIAGGQSLKNTNGQVQQFLPRRWTVTASQSSGVFSKISTQVSGQISSRIFLGNEYEYFVESTLYTDLVRMFSNDRFEIGTAVEISYKP